jgi:hypothetical protein
MALLDASDRVHDRAVFNMIRTALILAVLLFQSALFLRYIHPLRPKSDFVS